MWLVHLFKLCECEMPYQSSLYDRARHSIECIVNHYQLRGSVKPRPIPPVFAELGPGRSLGVSILAMLLGAKECWNFENDDPRHCQTDDNQEILGHTVDALLNNTYKRNHLLPTWDNSESNLRERARAISAALDGDNNAEAAVHIQHHWQSQTQDHIENHIDLLISHTTMEHVRQSVDAYTRIHKILKVGGIQSHYYGWCDHNNFEHQNGHLALTRDERDKEMPTSMWYLNCMPPIFHKGVIADLGSRITVWELHPYTDTTRPLLEANQLPHDTLYTPDEIHIRHGFGEAVKIK
jgi:hypothetical protein